jgi:hypothetical protein
MALLDRFRNRSPAWQHPDPAVRADAVRSLGAEDRQLLLDLAKSDAEPSVRKVALRRLNDAGVLGEAAREDADPGVREEAQALLLRIASETQDEPSAERALGALTDPRSLAAVARAARLPQVALSALARLGDARAVSAAAKTSEHAAVRLLAVERLDDRAALADVALKSDHKDAALAALERVEAVDALKAIALHARHKAAARRARALLQAKAGTAAALTPEERRARASELLRSLEALAASHDWPRVRGTLAAATAGWQELAAESRQELAQRFEAARRALASRLEAHDAQQHASLAQSQELRQALSQRIALCERAEAAEAGSSSESAAQLQADWAALLPLDSADARTLAARFERALRGLREREARTQAENERRQQLDALVAKIEALAEPTPESGSESRDHQKTLRGEWERLAAAGPVSEEQRARVEAVFSRLAEQAKQARLLRERAEQENHARLAALCARAGELAKARDLTLKNAERALREIRAALEDPGPLPGKKQKDELVERLKSARAALYPRLQELREADEWKRWANAGVQEELCARMEALVQSEDLDKAALELKELCERWRRFKEARKQEAEPLWQRFKAARDAVHARVEEHLKQRAEEERRNLERKQALCEKAEALASSTDWLRSADEFKRLQNEWKAVGPVPRKHSQPLWERFHAACDRFFTARKQDLEQRKQEWAGNLEKKEALIAQAEAVRESSDWEPAAAEIRRLQAEWKKVGPVRKNKSEAVWARFRAACDAFFERYKRKDELISAEHAAGRDALVAELESFLADGAAPLDLAERVRGALARWQKLPGDRGAAERFFSARDRVIERFPDSFKGTELDPAENTLKREKLIGRVEALVSAGAGPLPATASLADRLKEALATNAMGGRAVAETRFRAAAEEVESAQAAWKRLGPVPGEAGRALAERFKRACDRFYAQRPR